jgi:hypothetical protein
VNLLLSFAHGITPLTAKEKEKKLLLNISKRAEKEERQINVPQISDMRWEFATIVATAHKTKMRLCN